MEALFLDDSAAKQAFLASLRESFDNAETYPDVTIICGASQIQCHKLVLSARSEWFQKAFSGKFVERDAKMIELHDDSEAAVRAMLQYCYQFSYDTNQVPDFNIDVYAAAEKYLVSGLPQLALENLARAMRNATSDEIAGAVHKAYTATSDPQRKLRDYFLDMVMGRCDEILTGRCPTSSQLLSKVPAFATDLVPLLANSKYLIYHKFYDRSIYEAGSGSLFFLYITIGRGNARLNWISKLAVLLNDAIICGAIQGGGSFHYSPLVDERFHFEKSHRHRAGPQLYHKLWTQSNEDKEKWAHSSLDSKLELSSMDTKQWGPSGLEQPVLPIWTADSTFSGHEGRLDIISLRAASIASSSMRRTFEQWPASPDDLPKELQNNGRILGSCIDIGCDGADIRHNCRLLHGLASTF